MHKIKKIILLVILTIACRPGISLAKASDDQNQIILLNDSAAALEDVNPGLSAKLSAFADDKEKEWEAKNANKDTPPVPVTDKMVIEERVTLLTSAALAIRPLYPLIANGLNKMAHEMNRSIENEE